ncbi:YncE family protein [Tengunoibacter tsumagoiensis]|uniref:Uncharacterized protein n=1 Tax=Tengunoibacter tsumagoiensis TaxID=2014871 RepID=A0A401ZXT8_9CHLR|nr:cytochrome C nitrite reductase [Tengunoibacter tsumagoiensis]GCE11645.1 hypothetical protein KTT_15040 [Tengunoibacter tsumagoiensis]
MRHLRYIGKPLLLLTLFFSFTANTYADTPNYQLSATMQGPNIPAFGFWVFDTSWVDASAHRYYFSDSSNARVDIFDTDTHQYLNSLSGFTGYHNNSGTKGPDGLLVDDQHRIWAGDGDSTVKVFNQDSLEPITTISTGGKARADELTYDAQDHLLAVTNGSEVPPFVSFIDTQTYQVVSRLSIPGANGIEQPHWDPISQHFLIAIPTTNDHPGGEIAVVDPLTRSLLTTYPLPDACQPSGLASGPGRHLLVGCDGNPVVLDTRNGNVVATISQVSSIDQVWYNSGDRRYYLAAGRDPASPSIGVIDAESLQWLTNIPVAPNSHSVAVDARTNQVYVPEIGQGIDVYCAQ